MSIKSVHGGRQLEVRLTLEAINALLGLIDDEETTEYTKLNITRLLVKR